MPDVFEDTIFRAEGDYETHDMRYSDNTRVYYALNTRTGSRLDEGWYDWPSRLQHVRLDLVLPSSGRRVKSPADIYSLSNETWSKRLGVAYEEPGESRARQAYYDEFRERHGVLYLLHELDLPWPELRPAEIDEVITEFLALLNYAPKWGATGMASKYDRFFEFQPRTAKGSANARFLMKKGEVRYDRIQ